MTMIGTSASGPMLKLREIAFCIGGALACPGTAAAEPIGESVIVRPMLCEQTNSGAVLPSVQASGAAVMEVRRLSGLTWDQLASLFGVSRRTIHFWASGKPINAGNEERLLRVLALIRKVSVGNAQLMRSALLSPLQDGGRPFDMILDGKYDEVQVKLGTGTTVSKPYTVDLSAEAREARRPPKPESLMEALQTPIRHKKIGKGRPARSVKIKRRS